METTWWRQLISVIGRAGPTFTEQISDNQTSNIRRLTGVIGRTDPAFNYELQLGPTSKARQVADVVSRTDPAFTTSHVKHRTEPARDIQRSQRSSEEEIRQDNTSETSGTRPATAGNQSDPSPRNRPPASPDYKSDSADHLNEHEEQIGTAQLFGGELIMTSRELDPVRATAIAFAATVTKAARAWGQLEVVPAAEAGALRNQLDALVTIARMRAIGELAQVQIREIEKTYRLIEESNLSEPAYSMAMRHLEDLSRKLADQMDKF